MARVQRTPNKQSQDRLRVIVEGLPHTVGKVGWFKTAKYPNGVPVAYVAAVQEFGYRRIPPRLGMRATADAKRKEWGQIAFKGAKAILGGQMQARQVMELIGLKAAGDLKKHISAVTSPPLSPITIELRRRRRGGATITGRTVGEAAKASSAEGWKAGGTGPADKPLIDTAYLFDSLTNTVEKK